MARVYVLVRDRHLPPLVFSSLKKAKDAALSRYPFIGAWRRVGFKRPGKWMPKQFRGGGGFPEDSPATISSVLVDVVE